MEHSLINRTRFVAQTLPTAPVHPDALTVMVKATFQLSPGGPASLAGKQLPLTGTDEQVPGADGMLTRYESDFVPYKPRADVLCVGKNG